VKSQSFEFQNVSPSAGGLAQVIPRSRRGPPFSSRRCLFLLALTGSITTCLAVGVLPQIREHPGWQIATFFLLLPFCLAVTFTWPRTFAVRTQVVGILFFALVLRLALLPHPADSDVNRYLWEGRLIREGFSPYSEVASAQEWIGQRDPYWAGMNQKDLRTIYPPIAEWIFAAIGGVWYHPMALKAVFIVLDLASVALILALLSARSQPLRLAGLYAFNPVSLIGFAAEGHFDPILIFLTLLALCLRERRRYTWSWIVFGLAIQTKLVAVILAPLFLRRGGWRTAWIGVAVTVLPFLPYAHDVGAWLAGVGHFGADFGFNGSGHALMSILSGNRNTASVLCAALLVVWIFVITIVETDLLRAAFFVLGGLIVLSPIVHYWYVSWALIFVPLFPSTAWIILSGSMALSFLLGQTPHLWQTLIWTTFGILLTREAIRVVPALVRRRDLYEVSSLAIVVPVLNESSLLENCLHSVARMSPRPDELIVVDGGSIDRTCEIATRLGATVVSSEPGRGRQIAAGAAAARSDVVLVVHADSEVLPDTGSRIRTALNTRAEAVGGAVGQRFDRDAPTLCVIECLNEIRAVLLGLSFGDQGQFFRRAAIMASGGFPELPLMEDVELSLRLRAAGPMLYLGGGLICSGRRWQHENWLKRSLTVIAMTTIYVLHRRHGERIAHILYKRYYSAAPAKA
jgi:rSAM/selenodomain-associated transferase 2